MVKDVYLLAQIKNAHPDSLYEILVTLYLFIYFSLLTVHRAEVLRSCRFSYFDELWTGFSMLANSKQAIVVSVRSLCLSLAHT